MTRIVLVGAAFLASAIGYFRLPDRVPVHWDLRGQVDRHGHPLEALMLMPLLMLGVWALFRFLPRIDPLRANYARFAGAYDTLIDAILGMMLATHIAILLGAAGASGAVVLLVRGAVGVLFIVVGMIMPRMRQNWFVGVRTPWTLSSARVWDSTHRFAGRMFVLLGILALATLPLAPQIGIPLLVAGAVAVGIGSLVHSYLEWRKEQAEASPAGE